MANLNPLRAGSWNIRQRIRRGWRKIKRTAEWLGYGVFDGVALSLMPPTTMQCDLVAAVYLHLMGDYFLWLPFARALARDQKHIVFACNAAWADLASTEFPDHEIVGIDVRRFLRDWRYRLHTLGELRRLGATRTLCFAHPRDRIVHDAVVAALAAPAIGHAKVYGDRPRLDAWWSRRQYSPLVRQRDDAHRSFQHQALLDVAGISEKPDFSPPVALPTVPLLPSEPFFVVSPGASHMEKSWPSERFVSIAKQALELHPDLQCVLVGAPSEAVAIARMRDEIGPRAISLAGANTLPQLQTCIQNAIVVLSNDSAAAHIAAICGVPSIVVVSGGTYGVCQPYPMGEPNVPYPEPPRVAAHPMPCFGCDWSCRYKTPSGQPLPCLDAVQIADVWNPLRNLLVERLN